MQAGATTLYCKLSLAGLGGTRHPMFAQSSTDRRHVLRRNALLLKA